MLDQRYRIDTTREKSSASVDVAMVPCPCRHWASAEEQPEDSQSV